MYVNGSIILKFSEIKDSWFILKLFKFLFKFYLKQYFIDLFTLKFESIKWYALESWLTDWLEYNVLLKRAAITSFLWSSIISFSLRIFKSFKFIRKSLFRSVSALSELEMVDQFLIIWFAQYTKSSSDK